MVWRKTRPADGTLAAISRDFGTSVWQLSVKVIWLTAPKHTILAAEAQLIRVQANPLSWHDGRVAKVKRFPGLWVQCTSPELAHCRC